jgi:2-(1,2-epoxy-1,2-dihydrophenyl)acetyl-CoA isomerase
VRVVLLSAAGRHFSGGGDLTYFTSLGDGVGAGVRELATHFHTIVSRMVRLDVPVIAAVKGAVAGGGLSLALAADLVVAADTAKLTVAYSNIAFSVDGGLSYSLPRLVGLRRALDLALTNRVLSAAQALEIGMISEVVPAADLEERSQVLAAKLAAGSRLAQARIKGLLRRSLNETLETQLEHETHAMAETTGSPDGIEGVAAFMAKRPPKFG